MTMDASEMGRKGGQTRARRMSKQERIESARKAVQARWAKAKKAAAKMAAPKRDG